MRPRFEELDWRQTPIGAISLRRRWDPLSNGEVFEVKLDDEYLMSSLFTVAETELARLGLATLADTDLDVVVGGLGLGYTACAVLEDRRVRSLTVVEALTDVIEWHRRDLLPLSGRLTADPRTRLVAGDFFALVDSETGFDPAAPKRRFHAVLLDIDHTPRHLLDPGHAWFYTPAGLGRLADHLRPDGVFALWSNETAADNAFTATLAEIFTTAEARVVTFRNPIQGRESSNTIYIARR